MGVSTQIKIGTTLGGMVTLASLGVSSPAANYRRAAEIKQTISGSFVRRGSASITLDWQSIKQEEIEALRVYCSGASAPVYIYAPSDVNRAYATFSGIMVWPEREDGLKFQLKIINLVTV